MRVVSLLVSALLAVTAVLLLAGCGGSGGSTEIAFVSSRDGDYAIFGMAADGSGEQRLSEGEGDPSSPTGLYFQVDPAWSPDGESIAFASRRSGSSDIYVMAADGTGTRQLTTTKDFEGHPSFSPDGESIVYSRGESSGDLWVMSADGSGARRIGSDLADEIEPAWSPDGGWIAYSKRQPGTNVHEIWVVRPDGTGRRQVTSLGVASYSPAWSPDSSRIAFAASVDEGPYAIYEVELDGAEPRRLTDGALDGDLEPAYAPGGALVSFSRDGALVTVNGEGEIEELTDAENNDSSAVWRPVVPEAVE